MDRLVYYPLHRLIRCRFAVFYTMLSDSWLEVELPRAHHDLPPSQRMGNIFRM